MASSIEIKDGIEIVLDDKLEKVLGEMKKFREDIKQESNYPLIKKYKLFNFKGIKKLSFKKFKESFPNFNWSNIREFYGIISSDEATYRSNYDIDAIEYFYLKNLGILPYIYIVRHARYNKKFITDLFTYLNPPQHSLRIVQEFGDHDMRLREFTLMFENDLIMHYDTNDLIFFLNPNKHLIESNENPFYRILQLLAAYKNDITEKNKINIVYKSDYGFDKLAFDVKKIDLDINTNYNDDFAEISKEIIKNLNDKKHSGLYILDGEPGVGKTSFIRYLTGKIKRNIIFVSPDMVNYITDPSFIPFLMNNNDSVLIIEDAEPALQKRDGSNRTGAISNILNLTDGLLSDCLNISIVATFNTNTRDLDDALLREGRLISGYSFKRLSIEKSIILLNKLGHGDVAVEKPMTLAEIYYFGKNNKGSIFRSKIIQGFVNYK